MTTDQGLIQVRILVRQALLSEKVMEWGGLEVSTEDKVDWLSKELWKLILPLREEIARLQQEIDGLQDHVEALEAETHDPDDCVVLSLVDRTHNRPPEAL